jgi:hypothetical protein
MNKSNNGYIALMTVILMGAIVSAITVTLLTLSIVYNKNSITYMKQQTARNYSDSCAEEALRIIRTKVYTGSGSLDINGDSVNDCNYIISGTQPNLTINTENIPSPADGPKRKLQIVTTAVLPKIIILSWNEIP